jgi:ribosomal protein S12 methylthiotransferase
MSSRHEENKRSVGALMEKGLHFVSLGCPKNQVDAEVLMGLLLKRGFRYVETPEEAEVIVVNTCAFLQEAVREAIEVILEMSSRKRPEATLVVSGCLPKRYEMEIAKELPEVDLWIGPGDIPDLPRLLEEKRKGFYVSKRGWLYDHTLPRIRFNNPFIAYLKIAEGCPHRCSFCTIPSIRGRLMSRPPQDILEEAKRLIDEGVKELILVAQDLTSYGKDMGLKNGLFYLLEKLSNFKNGSWIRLLYLYPHPRSLTKDLISLVASSEAVVPYLDLPIQHISDRILKLMNRKTTKKDLLKLFETLSLYPQLVLRGTVIVGFPGESDKDFEELLSFIEEGVFHYLGVFKFSPEEGTPALSLPDQVEEKIKEERYKALMGLQQSISLKKNKAFLGKRIPVLVEGTSGKNKYLGRTYFQAPEIDGFCLIRGNAPLGEIIWAEVIEAYPYDLVVKPVREVSDGGVGKISKTNLRDKQRSS